jgi:hypothetical protein
VKCEERFTVVIVRKLKLLRGRKREMTLNELRDDIFRHAAKQGFHGEGQDDLCKKLMLVIDGV